MKAHSSRQFASIDDTDRYKEAGSKAAYLNSLDSSVYSESSVLQKNVQEILKAELQSEAMKGEDSSAYTHKQLNIHFVEIFTHIYF